MLGLGNEMSGGIVGGGLEVLTEHNRFRSYLSCRISGEVNEIHTTLAKQVQPVRNTRNTVRF